MALQSSGQIKLSEIATEFGGTAPHSLSEYHGKGNAPASGEIQLAADFYGTSNITYLADGTVTAGRVLDKSSKYFYGRHENTPNANANIGSFSLSTNTIGLNRAFQDPINENIQTTGSAVATFRVTDDRIDIDTVKLGSTTKRRRYGELDFVTSTDKNVKGTFPIMNLNSTYDVEIVKFDDDDPFCTMTFTAAHWTTTSAKGETLYHRGYNTSGGDARQGMSPKGSATSGTTAVRNPENNSSITTVTGVFGEDATNVQVGGGYKGRVYVTVDTADDLRDRIRFAVLSRSTDSSKIVLRLSDLGNSDFEPSGTKLTADGGTNNHLLFNTTSSAIYSFINSTSATYTLKIV